MEEQQALQQRGGARVYVYVYVCRGGGSVSKSRESVATHIHTHMLTPLTHTQHIHTLHKMSVGKGLSGDSAQHTRVHARARTHTHTHAHTHTRAHTSPCTGAMCGDMGGPGAELHLPLSILSCNHTNSKRVRKNRDMRTQGGKGWDGRPLEHTPSLGGVRKGEKCQRESNHN